MSKSSKRHYETPIILSDAPLGKAEDQAYFHFDDFARTLARLIADRETRTPLTIGISGAWGSGKTTLLRRIQRQLDQTTQLKPEGTEAIQLEFTNPEENPQQEFRVCRTVWFNAWKYADEEALLVALVRVIVHAMFADESFSSKAIAALIEPFTARRNVIDTVLSWFSIKVDGMEMSLNTGKPEKTPFAEKSALLDQFDPVFDHLLAGWVHYLAFDLFIGAWETRDAAARGVPHAWVVPCLLMTFLLGPIGLLAYLAIRGLRVRTLELA